MSLYWSFFMMSLLGRAFEIDASPVTFVGENRIERVDLPVTLEFMETPGFTGVDMILTEESQRNLFCIEANNKLNEEIGDDCKNQLYGARGDPETFSGRPGYFLVQNTTRIRGLLCNPNAKDESAGFVVVATPKNLVLDNCGHSTDLNLNNVDAFHLTIYVVTPTNLRKLL